jgi:hypothetical protein
VSNSPVPRSYRKPLGFLIAPLAGLGGVMLLVFFTSGWTGPSSPSPAVPETFASWFLVLANLIWAIPCSYLYCTLFGCPMVSILERRALLTLKNLAILSVLFGSALGLGVGFLIGAHEHMLALTAMWLAGVVFSVVASVTYWIIACL